MKEIEVHRDNLAKHGVSPEEAVECLRPSRQKYLRKVGRNIYQVITQISSGRYLEVLYKELADKRFVFHAMDARPRDIRLLRRRGNRR
jgi:hypothetical protein